MNQRKTATKAATRESEARRAGRALAVLAAMTLSLFAVYCLI